MEPLYRQLGLSAKQAGEIMAVVTELLSKKLDDAKIIEELCKIYKEKELIFGVLTLGRLLGMVMALNEPEKARAIIKDFFRFIKILKEEGREKLAVLIENEILEEVVRDVDRLKDVV